MSASLLLTLPWLSPYMRTLHWRHNKCDDVSNHRRLAGLLNRSFRRPSTKTSKLWFTGLCEENSPVTGEIPSQRASNAENDPVLWRHYELCARGMYKGQGPVITSHNIYVGCNYLPLPLIPAHNSSHSQSLVSCRRMMTDDLIVIPMLMFFIRR